jgi:hypothetical protein
MEAAGSSQTLITFYKTTRRHIPEDSHRRVNLKLHIREFIYDFFNEDKNTPELYNAELKNY